MKNNKIIFLYGLGERKEYKNLFNNFIVPKIDWNKCTVTPKIGNVDTLVSFSLGALFACQHTEKHKVKTLILCSITPGAETLENVKAGKVIFLAGKKEKWVIKEIKRVAKTLRCDWQIHIIPKAIHKITGNYRKKLLEIVNNAN